jgi:hypothetical protein
VENGPFAGEVLKSMKTIKTVNEVNASSLATSPHNKKEHRSTGEVAEQRSLDEIKFCCTPREKKHADSCPRAPGEDMRRRRHRGMSNAKIQIYIYEFYLSRSNKE